MFAKGSAGARVDDEVGVETLDGGRGGHAGGFATNEVAAVHLSVEHDTEACALNLAFVELTGEGREEIINFLYSVAVDEGLGFSHHRHDVAYCLHVFICEYIYK